MHIMYEQSSLLFKYLIIVMKEQMMLIAYIDIDKYLHERTSRKKDYWLMKNKKLLYVGFMLCILLLVITSCAPGDGTNTVDHPAGFFSGIWHGWIAPFTLVISLFNKDIGIYEINNVGFWYNFGYYMAIISGFGGLTLSRKKRRHKDHDDE